MRIRHLIILCALLGAALALPFARPAYAGEDDDRPSSSKTDREPVDYVAKLTPQELAFLRSRIQGWEHLDAAKRQRIARNVVRIRNLGPEQRKAFQEKIRRLRGKGGHAGPQHFRDHATRMLVTRALAQQARKQLGRRFEEQMRRRDISQHAFEMAFSMAFWRSLADGLASGGAPPAPDALPAGIPDHHLQSYALAHAEYAKATEAKRKEALGRRLWLRLAMFKGDQFRGRLQRTDLRGEAYVAAVGAAMRKEWGEVFEKTIADPTALLDAAERVEVKRGLRRLLQRSGRLDRDESALLLSLLGRLATQNLKSDAAAAARTDEAIKLVLQREFGLSPEDIAKLPAASDPKARASYLQRVLRERLGRRFGPPGRSRVGPRSRGPVGPPKRPEGVSDADWAIFVKAMKAARSGGGRPDFRAKPEGMSDVGWRLIRESLRKRSADRRRGG